MIEIRTLSSLAEFSEALHLQQSIWHFADIELLPLRFFVVPLIVDFGIIRGTRK